MENQPLRSHFDNKRRVVDPHEAFPVKEAPMKVNEGMVDRAVRIVLGLALISLVYVGPKTSWGWIGLLPLATGIIGFCGLYALLGITTCPMKKGS